jgi:hypothetical protein
MSDRITFVSQRIRCPKCIEELKKFFEWTGYPWHFEEKHGIFSGYYGTTNAFEFALDIPMESSVCHEIRFAVLEESALMRHYAMTLHPEYDATWEELVAVSEMPVAASARRGSDELPLGIICAKDGVFGLDVTGREGNVMEALEAIDKYFRSGNSIPVERATIRREEWEALKAEVLKLEAYVASDNELMDAISSFYGGGQSHVA